MSRLLFLALLALALWHRSPPAALAAGILFGLLLEHPYPSQSRTAAKLLLQASVVGLGFAMNFRQVLAAGAGGLLYTAGGIVLTMLCGLGLGRLLGVKERVAFLISTGTAICGGSAIAAVGPIVEAEPDEMSVALGAVFLLNSAALLLFPAIGSALSLSQEQFGLWAALSIHDTSSVVGATVRYGAAALAVGTTVKLARALWIVPLALGTAALRGSKAKTQWPWFILLFVAAAALNSYVPAPAGLYGALASAARAGLTVTLFLIGSGLSTKALRAVGARPLVLATVLWALVSVLSLSLIAAGVIA